MQPELSSWALLASAPVTVMWGIWKAGAELMQRPTHSHVCWLILPAGVAAGVSAETLTCNLLWPGLPFNITAGFKQRLEETARKKVCHLLWPGLQSQLITHILLLEWIAMVVHIQGWPIFKKTPCFKNCSIFRLHLQISLKPLHSCRYMIHLSNFLVWWEVRIVVNYFFKMNIWFLRN